MSNPPKQKQKQKAPQAPPSGSRGKPLRGFPKDSPEVRLSKTLSWILRHGAKSEGLFMRSDGYVRVNDLLALPRLSSPAQLDLATLQRLVENDSKSRYMLHEGPDEAAPTAGDIWWIRANQGHSLKEGRDTFTAIKLDLKPILSATDIPMGVHGTNRKAWESICQYRPTQATQGLSRMGRNHIHLAQGVPGDGVISGMRNSAQVLIYVDVQKALDAGITFSLSENGVVLTEGDERGFLSPEYFLRVEDRQSGPIPGWPLSSTRKPSEATDIVS
ncbi:KptA family-domain-containing protein [Lactarius sanguifluus]|nr:KptA family-domain-containing protein [Lactarius sanguifluus]